jgi:hypothetical protein
MLDDPGEYGTAISIVVSAKYTRERLLESLEDFMPWPDLSGVNKLVVGALQYLCGNILA